MSQFPLVHLKVPVSLRSTTGDCISHPKNYIYNHIYTTCGSGLKCNSNHMFTDTSHSGCSVQIGFQIAFCITLKTIHNDNIKTGDINVVSIHRYSNGMFKDFSHDYGTEHHNMHHKMYNFFPNKCPVKL